MLSPNEIASMSAVVASSFDVTVTVSRDTSKVKDTYGHTTSGGITSFSAQVNVFKPGATQLQIFADIIGSQDAVMIRFLPTTDIREGDTVLYNNKNWKVNNIQYADSYTFANNALMTVIL